MNKIQNDEKKNLEELAAKRNLLFEELLKNPLDIRPALEIRLLDDQIAELRSRRYVHQVV